MEDFVIMDVTTGDTMGVVFETIDEADKWIEEQDIPGKYLIAERE